MPGSVKRSSLEVPSRIACFTRSADAMYRSVLTKVFSPKRSNTLAATTRAVCNASRNSIELKILGPVSRDPARLAQRGGAPSAPRQTVTEWPTGASRWNPIQSSVSSSQAIDSVGLPMSATVALGPGAKQVARIPDVETESRESVTEAEHRFSPEMT